MNLDVDQAGEAEQLVKQNYLKKSLVQGRECKTSSPILLMQGKLLQKQIQTSIVAKQQSPDYTLHQTIANALQNTSQTKSNRDHLLQKSHTLATKSIQDFTEMNALKSSPTGRVEEPKFDIFSIFALYGLSIEEILAQN